MVKRSRFVVPIMAGGFCRGYRDLADPTLQWTLPGNPTRDNPHAETFHLLHMQDGSLLLVGTSERNGAITSFRHVIDGQADVHVVRHVDEGQGFLPNLRARVNGVEQNPTSDGGSAGTHIFYPSVGNPISVTRAWDGSLIVRRTRHAIIDFDPDNLEDGWGKRPVPADMPADTQLLWTGCVMECEHAIRTDGRCHTYTFTFRDLDGSPDGVEKAWLSCGMLLADVFHGGADLIDLDPNSAGPRRLRGDEWRGVEHPTIAHSLRRAWNGFRTRVGLLEPGKGEQKQPAAWPSGHAATILYTGLDGQPDGKFALGIYAHLVDTRSTDPIGAPERMQVSVMRNPQFLTPDLVAGSKAMAMRNTGYGVVVGSQGNGAYPPGYSASISFDWITGAPAQVEAALRRQYLDRQAERSLVDRMNTAAILN